MRKIYMMIVVLSSRTDFSVDMSGKISFRHRHLSTKQWSGNKCGDVPTKIQTRFARWIIGTGRVNSGWLSIKHAVALTCSVNNFFIKMLHYYVDKRESLSICHIFSKLLFCRQFCRQRACRRQH